MSTKIKINIIILSINVFALLFFTYSWFFLEDPTGDLSNIKIFTGDYTYVSTHPDHGFEPSLDFENITIGEEYITNQHLRPVTSHNGYEFQVKYGIPYSHPASVKDRFFLDFDIYLKTNISRYIYLGVASGFDDDEEITSLSNAIRVSFTSYSDDINRVVEKSVIWEPTNSGLGSYGELFYDNDYPYIDDERFLCYTEANPDGVMICPSEEKKTYYQAHSYNNEELMVSMYAPDEGEDLSDVPHIIELEGGSPIGRLLTIRIWLEGFDPDSARFFDLSDEDIKVKIEFTMSLYFAARRLDEVLP